MKIDFKPEQFKTASDKIRFIANLQEKRRESGFVYEEQCDRQSWAVARMLLPVAEEDIPALKEAYQGLAKAVRRDTLAALRHAVPGRVLRPLLGIDAPHGF